MIKERVNEKYKTPYLEVLHNEEKNVIIYKWIGRISDQDARNGMTKILNIIRDAKAEDLVADLTAFTGGSVETAKWVNEEWSQLLVKAGLKHVAVKLPESAFGGFSNTVALGPKFVSLLKVEKFVSLDDVYRWIEERRSSN